MSNIEKIKAKIENSIKAFEFNGGIYDPYEAGELSAYKEILDFIDSLPEDDLPKTKGWVARNKDESLVFCYHKPHRENSITQEWWGSCDADFRIYDDAIDEQFKDLKWEDEPIEVELFIKPIDEPKEMSVDEAMAYLKEKIAKASKSWEGVDVDKFMDEIRGREPDDLEEASEKFARLYDQGTCDGIAQDCFIAGAKWQKAKDDEETADLMTIVALDAGQRARESMPEDTVIFQKGVAEGRRLEREDRNDDNLPRLTKDYYYGG